MPCRPVPIGDQGVGGYAPVLGSGNCPRTRTCWPAPRTPPKRGSLPSSRAATPVDGRVRLHTRTVRSRSMSHSDPLIGLSDW